MNFWGGEKMQKVEFKTKKIAYTFLLFSALLTFLVINNCASSSVNNSENDIWVSKEWSPPEKLPAPVNGPEWEDGPSISPDGKVIYFSRGKETKNIKAYMSRKDENGWSNPKPLEINVASFPTGAPHSQDEKTLYFASVRPGTYGLGDIYVCRNVNGKWDDVKNLGQTINTKDMESEPFISLDGKTLYFASTRKGGMGKADIWMAKKTESGWGKPINIGSPVNTKREETQPFVTEDGHELYFTAMNRNKIPGPAIFRSIKKGEKWGEPEVVISGFVGEPTLTANKEYLFFVHLVRSSGKLVDGEIMFVKRKAQ
jgi:Tol biopolymer transport system component